MIFLNSIPLEFKVFPNGETLMNEEQIRNSISFSTNVISLKYENDNDLIKLMFTKCFLDTLKIQAELIIYYMPYSRMDRSEGKSAFTLKYVTDFINGLNFDKIIVIEPHSDVTPALLNNCETSFPSVNILYDVKKLINFYEDTDYIYFPDSGAEKRYNKMIKVKNSIVGFKHRDFMTGKITSLDVLGASDLTGRRIIMIDDLSSYGGTFILGATELKKLGATRVYLVVGHAEESIYKGDIFKTDLIDKVFTTNSIITEELNDRIKIYPIQGKGVVG